MLDSREGENLETSLTVLRPGGLAIGVTGPPDPLNDTTFTFDRTVEALAYVEQGRANGKVVITLD